MPIARVPYPNALPTVQNDYVLQNNLLITNFYCVNEPSAISGANVTKGAVFQIGGVIYYCTADTAIGGAASNYVKISPDVGGATCTAAYVANLVGVAWNQAYNGYYDVGGSLYVFDEGRALIAGQIAVVVKRYLQQDRTGDVYVGRDLLAGRDVSSIRDLLSGRHVAAIGNLSGVDLTATGKIECYKTNSGGADTLLKTISGHTQEVTFYLKKPISGYYRLYSINPSGYSSLQIYQNGTWYTAYMPAIYADNYGYNLQLNPGYYKLRTGGNAGDVASLYCSGVYGDAAITAADIVT